LARRAQDGSFRADLFYRLAVFCIRTPALTEHAADLRSLVEHFLERFAEGGSCKRVTEEGFAELCAHSWPGNVRELQHVVERACILAEARGEITAADIEFDQP